MSSSGEYDAAFAATIAAAAYAIAAREEKLATQKKPIPIEGAPARRAESIKKPTGGSKISRWLSGKEPVQENEDGPGSVDMAKNCPNICHFFHRKTCKSLVTMLQCVIISVNVSVRRPLKPTPAKPEDTTPAYKVPPKMTESSLSVKKGSDSFNKSADKKGSKRFEQEQAIQKLPSTVRPATSYHSRRNGDTAIGGIGSKTDEWEKAKLARIREE